MNTNPGDQSIKALEADFNIREEAKLKEALSKFAHIAGCDVNIEIKNNTIHLTGVVASKEQKDDAETTIWMCMPDAEDVVNELTIEEVISDEVIEM